MVFKGSLLHIADNSGAKMSKCIHVYNKVRIGSVGDIIVITLRKITRSGKKIKKGMIYLGIIISIKFWKSRKNGFFIKFSINRVLIKIFRYSHIWCNG
jgi:ribosomal protein L14